MAFHMTSAAALEIRAAADRSGAAGLALRVAAKATAEVQGRTSLQYSERIGTVLKTVRGTSARYEARGDELYVRARVRDSGGSIAWTQPIFVQR